MENKVALLSRIFDLLRRNTPEKEIREQVEVSRDEIREAVAWFREYAVVYSKEEDLFLAIERLQQDLHQARGRLEELARGYEEVKEVEVEKEEGGDPSRGRDRKREKTVTRRYNPQAEVAYRRVIEDMSKELNNLKGLYQYLKQRASEESREGFDPYEEWMSEQDGPHSET